MSTIVTKLISKVPSHSAHVLLQLGLTPFIFYLEHGLIPELETKIDLLLGLMVEQMPPHNRECLLRFKKSLQEIRLEMKALGHKLDERLKTELGTRLDECRIDLVTV